MKICKKCGEEKPLEEFPKAFRRKDGRNSWCKVCTSKANKENRQKTKPVESDNFKGYKTYVNDDGVTCITKFDAYNMGKQHISKPKTSITETIVPR